MFPVQLHPHETSMYLRVVHGALDRAGTRYPSRYNTSCTVDLLYMYAARGDAHQRHPSGRCCATWKMYFERSITSTLELLLFQCVARSKPVLGASHII
jgi:hypothetical protein